MGFRHSLFRVRRPGSLELDLGTNQVFSFSDSGSSQSDKDAGLSLEFLFDMVLFERRPYTVNLMANRVERMISAPFTERYTLTTASYGAGLTLRHDLFPVQLNYRYFSSETDGLSVDRQQDTEELTLESNLRWGGISDTNLRALEVLLGETDST